MDTDTRIPCPPFPETLAALLEVVAESPQQRSRHAYLDSAGYPFDLLGHVLARLDAPINIAASGTYQFNGTRHHNHQRLPQMWNRLFLGGDGPDTPYDGRFTLFPKMEHDRGPAEDYLVFALLGHVQRRNDAAGYTWHKAVRRGLLSFRGFLNSGTSGFLVQTHGAHEDLRMIVDELTSKALEALDKTKATNE